MTSSLFNDLWVVPHTAPSQGMYKGKAEIINNAQDAHIWLVLPGESSQSLI